MYVCIVESIRTRVPYHTTWTTSEGGVVAKWDCDDIVTHTRLVLEQLYDALLDYSALRNRQVLHVNHPID